MVLIELGVHGRYLSLAEGVIKCVVDHLCRNPEPAGSSSVDDQARLESLILLIAVNVEQPLHCLELLEQTWPPYEEVLHVVALQCVLVLRVARAAAHTQVLHRLKIERDRGNTSKLLTQPRNDLVCVDLAFCQRLQSEKHTAGVQRSAAESAAIKGHDRIHSWVLYYRLGQLRDSVPHFLKRNILIALDRSVDPARVLLGKKALRNFHVEKTGCPHRQERHQKDQRLMLEHPGEGGLVFGENPLKHALAGLVQPPVFLLVVGPQQPRTHHRCGRQGNQQRDTDG